MDPGQWLTAIGSLVVVSGGVVFFGYGIYRERLKAAKEREEGMRAALERQSDTIDQLAAALKDAADRITATMRQGFQDLREDALKREVDELRRRRQ